MNIMRVAATVLLLCFMAVNHRAAHTMANTDNSSTVQADDMVSSPTALASLPHPWFVLSSAATISSVASPIGQTSQPPTAELSQTEVLTGTIFANRSDQSVQFFLDGLLYSLPPFRSVGVIQQQILAPLVLYSCRSDMAGTEASCSWDPYLVRQNEFYEITHRTTPDAPSIVRLQEANVPPAGQAWIQNRTGHSEVLLVENVLYEVENTHILELNLNTDSTSINQESSTNKSTDLVYLRRCLGLGLESVCEWLPTPITEGVYYALLDQTTPGPVADSAAVTIRLQPVLLVDEALMRAPALPEETVPLAVETQQVTFQDANSQPPPTTTPVVGRATLNCLVQAELLNVRAGPGLSFQVVDQIRNSDPGRVEVGGRDEAGTWLALADSRLAGGWIVNDQRWVNCEGNALSLPVSEPNQEGVTSAEVPAVAAFPGEPATQTDPSTPTSGLQCQIQTATLNVRSGPGLEYLIVGQIRRIDAGNGTFTAQGRNIDTTWLSVDTPSTPGGWIVGQAPFVSCETAVDTLPVVQVTDGRLAPVAPPPTPVTVAATTAENSAQEPPVSTADPTVETAVAPSEPQPVLTVVNAFEHEIRFTLDAAQHGLPDGTPSEYDLTPGQSLTIPIRAGMVRFSASSPFRNSSGNAEVSIDPGQSLGLRLNFIPTVDPERWELRY